jgi:hypothetical protein
MYFYFLLYLIRKMWFLSAVGLLTFLLDELFDEDVNTSPFETVYAMVCTLWGSVFVGMWLRRERELLIQLRCSGRNFHHYERTFNLSLIKAFQHDDSELYEHQKVV